MTLRRFIRPALAGALSWIAIAELLHGDIFLGANTILAAIYVLIEPVLRDAESSTEATVDTAPQSAPNHNSAFVAGAAATSRER